MEECPPEPAPEPAPESYTIPELTFTATTVASTNDCVCQEPAFPCDADGYPIESTREGDPCVGQLDTVHIAVSAPNLRTIYGLFGDTDNHFYLPPAHQSALGTFNNVGGNNIDIMNALANDGHGDPLNRDSWVTLGITTSGADLGVAGALADELNEWDDDHVLIDDSSPIGTDGALFFMNPLNSLEMAADSGAGVVVAQLALPPGDYSIMLSVQGYVVNTASGEPCATEDDIGQHLIACTYQSVGQTFEFSVGSPPTCAEVQCGDGYALVDNADSIDQPSVPAPPWTGASVCCELSFSPLPATGDTDRTGSIEGSASASYASIYPGVGHTTTTLDGEISYTSSLPTTVSLTVDLTSTEANVYSLFSVEASPLLLPPAINDASGADFGLPADAELTDSYLMPYEGVVSTPGLSLAGWSETDSFTVPEGAVYIADLNGPTGSSVDVVTVALPGFLPHSGASPYYYTSTLNVKGLATDGSEWFATGITVTGSVPAAPGCPFDSRGACEDGSIGSCPDGMINTADLLFLLSSYSTCAADFGCAYPSDNAPWTQVDGTWSGYPVDGFPQDGEGEGYGPGTWGDGIINVHDLLDLLGNFYRNYADIPCV